MNVNDLFTAGLLVASLLVGFHQVTHAQGVGVGTATPQAKLHVAGNVRIDTATTVLLTKRIATLDSLGVVHSMPFDSLKKQFGGATGLTAYSQEVDAMTSTTSNVPQVRVTLTLPPGTYLITGYFEAFNSNLDAGVRATFREGVRELGYGIVWSNSSTFGTWSSTGIVSPTVSTEYVLLWSSWPAGTTSYIRRARIIALKV